MKFVTAVVLFAVQTLASDVADVCPGTVPLRRVPSTGEGTWWLVAGTEMSSGSCGLNNNQEPCECVSFKFSSTLIPPYIPEYNASVYGYDTSDSNSARQDATLSLVDKTQPWAIFNFIDKSSNSATVVSALDTDDHENYIIFYLCGVTTADSSPIVFIVSKDKAGLSTNKWAEVDAVLVKNNITISSLKTFDTSSCLDSNLV